MRFGAVLIVFLSVLVTGIASLWCVPAALASMWLGMLGYKRLDENQFRRVVLWLLFASGIMLVVLNGIQLASK